MIIKKGLGREARHLLAAAKKVYHYRKDILTEAQLSDLIESMAQLQTALSEPKVQRQERIKRAHSRLDTLLRTCGGSLYPRTFWGEHAELFLVASVLAIGIRAFFLQPFKIPTNSMYPTYSGMIEEVFTEERPRSEQPLKQVFRKLLLWTKPYRMTAPTGGTLKIPLHLLKTPDTIGGQILFQPAPKRTFFFLPGTGFRYTFWIDETPVHLTVPQHFTLERVVMKTLYPNYRQFNQLLTDQYRAGRLKKALEGIWIWDTGHSVEAGQILLDFDVLSGDMLFVDRVSYHFRPPKVGDPIVFRTEGIPAIGADKYYIKRLVGLEGDTLEIREPVLYRNGDPIEGAAAFEHNAQRKGAYWGYENKGRLAKGEKELLPPGTAYGLGDHSPYSADSRIWGYIPREDIVGRALFIYYPFTERWGVAQ